MRTSVVTSILASADLLISLLCRISIMRASFGSILFGLRIGRMRQKWYILALFYYDFITCLDPSSPKYSIFIHVKNFRVGWNAGQGQAVPNVSTSHFYLYVFTLPSKIRYCDATILLLISSRIQAVYCQESSSSIVYSQDTSFLRIVRPLL